MKGTALMYSQMKHSVSLAKVYQLKSKKLQFETTLTSKLIVKYPSFYDVNDDKKKGHVLKKDILNHFTFLNKPADS